MQVASGAIFFGAVAWGIVDALYYYRPETSSATDRFRPPSRSVNVAPILPAVMGDALGPGLSFRF